MNSFEQLKCDDHLDTDKLYVASIGAENTAYYLDKFHKFDRQLSGLKVGWNFSAFTFGGFWAIYRKMYSFALVWFLGMGIIYLFLNMIGQNDWRVFWFNVLQVLFMVGHFAFAIVANSYYHNIIKRRIEHAREQFHTEDEVLECLMLEGGVILM